MATEELSRLLARRRLTEAEGYAAVKAWRRSGLPIAAFSRRHGLDDGHLLRSWAGSSSSARHRYQLATVR